MVDTRGMYLDLLKRCLLGMVYRDPPARPAAIGGWTSPRYIPKIRETGRDLPFRAHSMIGLRRMDNLQACIERVLADGVPGDLIETGVWRGGAVIFMRGVLRAYGVCDRIVWVADSFEGMPVPDTDRYPLDREWSTSAGNIAVPLETVRKHFEDFRLMDEQVCFLKGRFRDTLPSAPIERLAVLRLDGDLYESTHDALTALYPRLSPGGFVIVDDYNFRSCRQAVHDYRDRTGIVDPITAIDGNGVYWRRTKGEP